MKLDMKGKMLVIEKAKTPPKAKSINGQNIYPQTQLQQLDFDPENSLASRPLSKYCHP